MEWLSGQVLRRPRAILGGSLLVLLLAGYLALGASALLAPRAFTVPSWPSSRAAAVLAKRFPLAEPNVVIAVTATHGHTVDSPAVAVFGRRLTAELSSADGIRAATSYWAPGGALLATADRHEALVVGFLTGDGSEVEKESTRLAGELRLHSSAAGAVLTGEGPYLAGVVSQSEHDLARTQLIAVPLTALLLGIAFGGLVASLMPLAIAAFGVVGALAALHLIAEVTTVSTYASNVASGLGLGIAVDYALLFVFRYREELAGGRTPERALARTMRTAGRTIVLSAATVAVSMAALAILPMPAFRSFAYAGVATVVISAAAALVVLPALLVVLGPRLEAGRLRRSHPLVSVDPTTGYFYRRAKWTFRRAIPIFAGVGILLVVLGWPALGVHMGVDSPDLLPPGNPVRTSTLSLERTFPLLQPEAVVVVPPGEHPHPGGLADYAARLSMVQRVAGVAGPSGVYRHGNRTAGTPPGRYAQRGTSYLAVYFSVPASSPGAAAVAQDLRQVHAPVPVEVGGPAAVLLDTQSSLTTYLPLVWIVAAVACLLVLFLLAGSILIPLKAVVLNLLSLVASFGVTIWVFQSGHLQSLLGFTGSGTIDVSVLVLTFGVVFGLSMDYEMFLIARIKEEHDLGADNDEAVARGLQRTGRIVTAAAATMAVTFLAFLAGGLVTVKAIGLSLAGAVILDALVVRTVLVPALMHLAGRANWWAPRRLRRLHLLAGIWETEPLEILETGRVLSPEVLVLDGELGDRPATTGHTQLLDE